VAAKTKTATQGPRLVVESCERLSLSHPQAPRTFPHRPLPTTGLPVKTNVNTSARCIVTAYNREADCQRFPPRNFRIEEIKGSIRRSLQFAVHSLQPDENLQFAVYSLQPHGNPSPH
jgi:hypothetical protein